MSEQQDTTRATWKIYGDGMQVIGEAILFGAIAAVICVVLGVLFDAALVWALAPLVGLVIFAARIRARGAEVQDRLQKGQDL